MCIMREQCRLNMKRLVYVHIIITYVNNIYHKYKVCYGKVNLYNGYLYSR